MFHRYADSDIAFQNYSSFPKRILYPSNYLPHGSTEGQAIIEDFIQSMESTFGMERVVVNVTEEILSAGFNITAINRAASVLNSWVRKLAIKTELVLTLSRSSTNGLKSVDPSPKRMRPRMKVDSRRLTRLVGPIGQTREPTSVMLFTRSLYLSSMDSGIGSTTNLSLTIGRPVRKVSMCMILVLEDFP